MLTMKKSANGIVIDENSILSIQRWSKFIAQYSAISGPFY